MFSEVLNNNGCTLADSSIAISDQINITRRLCPESDIINITITALATFCSNEGRIKKTELLSFWKSADVPFACKCLATLWWGKPNRFVCNKVYTVSNLQILQDRRLEARFKELKDKTAIEDFKMGLETLYRSFLPNGEWYLNGIGTSFFTKFFHFYFAANPPKSAPGYLPVIADDIMRCAVFAEMIDRGENVDDVFHKRDASLCSYVAYADKFNEFVGSYPGLTAFAMEDVLFNNSRGIGKAYVDGHNKRLCLPHWIAGRYNEKENMAIVFNNLKGETYFFEGPTAMLWRDILGYEYESGFCIDDMCRSIGCSGFDIMSFMNELVAKSIIINHKPSPGELDKIKRSVNKSKASFLKSSKGIGNFHAAYESVDNDYRNRLEGQNIPFAGTIELTYACNEACVHCYNPNSPREGGIGTQKSVPTGELTAEEYFPILDKMAKVGVVKLVLTGGDPFMKKDFMKILQYAHKHKFAFSVYTNGQALYSRPDLYNELRNLYPQYVGLSLYSTIPEVHDSITRRKGSCEKTMEIARKCHSDALGLQIKCPIMQANKDSYGQVFDFAISVNGMPQFDVNITSGVDGDCFASERLRLTEEQMKVILKDERIPLSIENEVGVIERRPEMSFCGAGDSSFNIQPNGTLSPCPAFPLNCGNMREQSFDDLWKNSAELYKVRALRYKDSDLCGKEKFCKYCNRCIGQSFVESGVPQKHSTDNCFLAKIRYDLAEKQGNASSLK